MSGNDDPSKARAYDDRGIIAGVHWAWIALGLIVTAILLYMLLFR